MLIDITDNQKQINQALDTGFYGFMSGSAQMKTGFAVGGGVIGFIYAITNQKPTIISYVIGGLIVGAMVGWTAEFVMKKFNDNEGDIK